MIFIVYRTTTLFLLVLRPYIELGDVYNLAWSGHESNWLFAGTAAGLVGWKIEEEKVTPKYRPMMVDFLLPENERDKVRRKSENCIYFLFGN